MEAVVLGVNGMVGRAVAASLVRAGWAVRGTGRHHDRFPAALAALGVRFVRSDRRDPRELALAVGDGADLVVDCVCYTAEQARHLAAHRDRVGAAVLVSSKAVYVDDEGRHSNSDETPRFAAPVREDQAVLEPDFSGEYDSRDGYGANKVAAELALLDVDWPVTILRPSRIHGPGSPRPREWFVVRRVLDRREALPLASLGLSANHPTAASNVAALTTACATDPATRVLNVADPDAPTAAEVVRAVAAACGAHLDVVGLPHDAPAGLGANPWATWPPFLLDTRASESVPGYDPVPYATSVRDEVDWLLALDPVEQARLSSDPDVAGLLDYSLDDHALAWLGAQGRSST